jgi:hypothetical protein
MWDMCLDEDTVALIRTWYGTSGELVLGLADGRVLADTRSAADDGASNPG